MSEVVEKSIIIPMNPHGRYSGGSTPGSIVAVKWYADKKGGVLISFDRWCKYINSLEKPRLGFFYDSSLGKVTHRFSIVNVTDDNGVKSVKKYLPPWRKEVYKARNPGRRRTWMLIKDIFKLKEPKKLSSFGKERAQSFVYSDIGELEYSKEKESPDDFIDDIIYRCAVSGTDKLAENDLELIVWALMIKNNAEYVERQRSEDGGKNIRLDILMKTSKGDYVVMELKRGIAEKKTLRNQLRPYMMRVKRKLRLTKLKGIIVARGMSNDLEKELSKTANANISFIPYKFALNVFSFDF